MVATALGQFWAQDLPVCLPGRACVDQSPVAAPLIDATSALTSVSPLIAAGCFGVIGLALPAIAVWVVQQSRGRGVSRWLVMLVAALLLLGVCTSWVVRGRLAVIAAIYSGSFGQAPALVPGSVIGAWPVVLAASNAMVILGGLSLIAVLATALSQRRRITITS